MQEKSIGLDARQILGSEFNFIKNNIKEFGTFLLVTVGLMLVFTVLNMPFFVIVLFFLAGLLLTCFLVTLYKANLEKREYKFEEAFDLAKTKWLDYLLLMIISAPLILIGLVLLILPGVYLANSLALSVWLVFFNDMKAIEAMKTSFHLVKKKWLNVFLVVLISVIAFALFSFILNMILSLGIGLVVKLTGIDLNNFVLVLTSLKSALALVSTILYTTCGMFIYLGFKEKFGLELQGS